MVKCKAFLNTGGVVFGELSRILQPFGVFDTEFVVERFGNRFSKDTDDVNEVTICLSKCRKIVLTVEDKK